MKHLVSLVLLSVFLGSSCQKNPDGSVSVVPIEPGDLTATAESSSVINLSWKDNSTNEDGFKIDRKNANGNFEEIGTTKSNITAYRDTSLQYNTSYVYRVYAYNNVGSSLTYSNEATATTYGVSPTISTDSITSVSYTTAVIKSTITSDGGSFISARGVCWSTTQNPTIALATKTVDGNNTGTFNSTILNLQPKTKYFVRAYSTNSIGTSYGNELSFTTDSLKLASVTTNAVNTITSVSAISGGAVVSDGGSVVTARGICWDTNSNPTIALSTKTANGNGTGSYSSVINNLQPSTTYYVRAYSTNSVGTSYGNEVVFTTTAPDVISGLIAYYPFSGNANDASGNNFTGTIYGATLSADRFGNNNSAYSFDGITNKIESNINILPVGIQSRTICFWFNQPIKSDTQYLVSYGGGLGGGGDFNCSFSGAGSGKYGIGLEIGGGIVSYEYSSNINTWYFYCVTYDVSYGTIVISPKIYLNGTLLTNILKTWGTASINTTNLTPFCIGGSSLTQWRKFKGLIDDVRVYNRVLTTSEIQYLYTH